MTQADIGAQVRGMVAQVLCLEDGEIDNDTPLGDYGLTSIDLLDVVAKLEARYQIRFEPSTMTNLTAGSLGRNVESLLAAQ